MPVTNIDIVLRLFVDDIALALASYTSIQLQRSTGDENGPWANITENAATAAVLTGQEDGPFLLNGLTLELLINGVSPVVVTFADPNPVSTAQAAAEITAALGALGAASDYNNYVRITTTATGTGASVQVTGGTGYSVAGFQVLDPYNFALGSDAHVALAPGVQDYEQTDHNGATTYWYRSRYYNTVTAAASPWFPPWPADKPYVLPSSELITGTCHLVDLMGRALANQRVHVYNLFEPSRRLVGATVYGVFGTSEVLDTDESGYASVALIRGSLVEVVWEGTSVRRRLRVPTAGTEFDLLDPSLADDEFGIQVPNWPLATRIP